jgi:hypothetical protein
MLYRSMLASLALAAGAVAADLPIREVTLYKHGVGYFKRSGQLAAGDTVQLNFKAGEMNDVLKSLTIVDAGGSTIAGVRYDASEPLERRLEDFPFAVGEQASLAAFLDQMKGARLELRLGPDTVAGAIVSARVARTGDENRPVEREIVVLLTDAAEIRSFDLSAASAVRLVDPKQQDMLRNYLTVVGGARSRDRRSVYIDASTSTGRQLTASYMIPTAVWKSSYRLVFGAQPQPTLEGWAIIDNTSGDEWSNVRLSVVSGRPISFITQLYEPRYVERPRAELAENRPVGPQVFEGALGRVASPAPQLAAQAAPGRGGGRGEAALRDAQSEVREFDKLESSVTANTAARDLGELFEYSFANPVTVKQGESAMLPFLQEKVDARKLLIYSESFGLHPMNAAEISNTTGKTLDGGPITVYDAGAYAGEALVETVKAGDKRLISYGVDLGTRVSTKWDSSSANVREIHFRRGVLTTRNSIQETRTYTIANVDAGRKTLIIEHPKRQGYELLAGMKASETTANAYRFEVAVGGRGTEAFAVREERVYDQSFAVSNLTPDLLSSFIQNRALSAAGRTQLERILNKKREIAANEAGLRQVQANIATLTEDQERVRRNIESLRQVAGQADLVQQYARQLSESEGRLAMLRDQEQQLRRAQATLQGELNAQVEAADF